MKSLVPVLVALLPNAAFAGFVLYGGNGGHPPGSINDGSLITIDQLSAAIAVVGHPSGVARFTGLAFEPDGTLFASTITGGGFPPPPPILTSTLLRIDPNTGAVLANIGPIATSPGGPPLSIADLAVQPGTGAIFGVQGPNDGLNGQGNLYTINRSTGIATLIGNTNAFFAAIAFAPNGTLYETAADLDAMGNNVNLRLETINPANGSVLTSVPTVDFIPALAVRPSDGVIFGGTGDGHKLYTISPSGVETLVGDTGGNYVGDLDFRAVPEPSTLALLGLGLFAMALRRRTFRYR